MATIATGVVTIGAGTTIGITVTGDPLRRYR